MLSHSRSPRRMLVRRARHIIHLRDGLFGLLMLLGLLLGLVLPAVRQRPFSSTRVAVAGMVLVLGAWSWATLMRARFRDKD